MAAPSPPRLQIINQSSLMSLSYKYDKNDIQYLLNLYCVILVVLFLSSLANLVSLITRRPGNFPFHFLGKINRQNKSSIR